MPFMRINGKLVEVKPEQGKLKFSPQCFTVLGIPCIGFLVCLILLCVGLANKGGADSGLTASECEVVSFAQTDCTIPKKTGAEYGNKYDVRVHSQKCGDDILLEFYYSNECMRSIDSPRPINGTIPLDGQPFTCFVPACSEKKWLIESQTMLPGLALGGAIGMGVSFLFGAPFAWLYRKDIAGSLGGCL